MQASLAVPFTLRMNDEADTCIVKPFIGTTLIIASYHVPVGDVAAEAVDLERLLVIFFWWMK